MAKFLTGNELNSELEKIFEDAQEQIILISPYIKLHDRFISTLKSKKDNPNLEITIVFGKNEDDLSKSMKYEDFEFFKEFPNIQIRHERRLHAKYYANETAAILSSMNLYSYSQDNNIEAGILTKVTLIGNIGNSIRSKVTGTDSLDDQAWGCFLRVIEQSDLLFEKKPQFDKGTLNSGFNKKYLESSIEVDKLSEFFSNKKSSSAQKRKGSFEKKPVDSKSQGYCIRTGVSIPFNTKRPFSDSAFTSWNKFKDPDYKEKFCHYSGEASNGETSFTRPILKKNWKKAMSS